MLTHDDDLSGKVKNQAEREMAAFLQVARDSMGGHDTARAADIWLDTMEALDWPEGDYERFFRCVTILAISQLCAAPAAQIVMSGTEKYARQTRREGLCSRESKQGGQSIVFPCTADQNSASRAKPLFS